MLPALRPAHPCTLGSSQLLPFLGVFISGLGGGKKLDLVRPKAGLHGGVAGARGENEVGAGWPGVWGTRLSPASVASRKEGVRAYRRGRWQEEALGKRQRMPHPLPSRPSSYPLLVLGPG